MATGMGNGDDPHKYILTTASTDTLDSHKSKFCQSGSSPRESGSHDRGSRYSLLYTCTASIVRDRVIQAPVGASGTVPEDEG